MKDIEALKKKQQREIELAIVGNKLEEELSFLGLEVRTFDQHFGIQADIDKVKYPGMLSYEQAGYVLTMLNRTGDIEYNAGVKTGKVTKSYRMEVHRYPNEANTTLFIEYQHNECRIHLEVGIKWGDDDWLGDVFIRDKRELCSYESHYPAYNFRDLRERFEFMTWGCGEIIRYEGGRNLQLANWVHEMVVERLKEAYAASTETQGEKAES